MDMMADWQVHRHGNYFQFCQFDSVGFCVNENVLCWSSGIMRDCATKRGNWGGPFAVSFHWQANSVPTTTTKCTELEQTYETLLSTFSLDLRFLFFPLQLIPLVAIIGIGGTMAATYLARLALFSPDVTWNRTKNPEPWERYRNKQYKVCVYLDMLAILPMQ